MLVITGNNYFEHIRRDKKITNLFVLFAVISLIMVSNTQGSPVKALLVEDIEVDTLLLTTMLSKFHCETTLAKNGKEAVDLFLEGKKFAIILCDKDMPVMTGPEVLYLFSHFFYL